MNSSGKSKSQVMKALMSHPGTSKMFKEALGSPLGSTSRSKAQKVFKIMSKLQGSYDGAGGPGMMMERTGNQEPTYSNPTQSSIEGMVVFHKLPPMNINYSGLSTQKRFNPQPRRYDGSGGPGSYDGEGGIGDWFNNALGAFKDAASTVGPGLGSTLTNVISPWAAAADLGRQFIFPPVTKIVAKDQPQPNFTPGLLSPQGIGKSIGMLGNAIKYPTTSIAAGLGSGLEYLGRNALSAGDVALKVLATGYTDTPKFQYTPFSDTYGVKRFAEIYPTLSNTSANVSKTTPTPAVTPATTFQTTPTSFTGAPKPFGPGIVQAPVQKLASTKDSNLLGTSSGPSQTQSSFNQNNSGLGTATINYSKKIGVDPSKAASIPFNTAFLQAGGGAMAFVNTAIIPNEGTPLVSTNPGNIIFNNLKGQIHSGVYNAEGNEVAAYATADAGKQAIADIVSNAAAGQSSIYGPNPTLQSFADTYTNTGAGSSSTVLGASSIPGGNTYVSGPVTGSSEVNAAIQSGKGPTTFAFETMMDKDNPLTGGKLLAQAEADNQKALWNKYNIGGLQKQEVDLRNASRVLPDEVTSYIRGRDQYLNQTNDMITDFVAKNSNLSNPDDARAAAAHLNYLYTLRGEQTKSYIEYFNGAIKKNSDELAHVTDMYSTALNAYQIDLTSANNVTEDMYKTYSSALQDMYNTVEGAPMKALQYTLLEEQIAYTHATSVSDATKALNQISYLADSTKLNGHITDTDGYVMQGIDLVKTLNDFSISEPGMAPTSIIQRYIEGVSNVLSATNNTSKTEEGTPIDNAYKIRIGKAAMSQFANLANEGLKANNLNTYSLGYNAAQDIATRIGNSVGGSLTPAAPQLIQAIQSLDPHASLTHWFPKPPSQDEFVKTVIAKTNGGVDAAIAAAIYANYQAYTTSGTQNGVPYTAGTSASYVQSMLYNLTDTASRTNPQPLTPDQIAQRLGFIYAQQLLTDSFGTPPAGITSP